MEQHFFERLTYDAKIAAKWKQNTVSMGKAEKKCFISSKENKVENIHGK